MILKPRQRKVFEEALATTNQVLPPLEFLERVAEVHPGIRERVQDLRTKREFLKAVAETALEADRIAGDQS